MLFFLHIFINWSSAILLVVHNNSSFSFLFLFNLTNKCSIKLSLFIFKIALFGNLLDSTLATTVIMILLTKCFF